MSEADLKRTVTEYLTIGRAQGRWWFERLNSGDVLVKGGAKHYKIKLCEEGTADFVVIRESVVPVFAQVTVMTTQAIFLELKSEKGRTSPAQDAFKIIVEAQGCVYKIIRSMEDLIEIVG
ncbi:hypothetical protein LCGC14_1409200 [marine sediment metagenome]|uniref:VRR-NUC domain-containing protein n=1 Tax=marine sediment metagenome TaxID=412755 RepID=A0A0F9JUT7_9ZZZZ